MPLLIQTPTGPQVASEEDKAELLALLGPLPIGPRGEQGEQGPQGERGLPGTNGQVTIANDLTTTDQQAALGADQGVELKAQIDALAESTSDGLQAAAQATAAAQAASAPAGHTHDLLMTQAERDKLGGVAPSATQNAADSALRDRSTHTGTQAMSTVAGLPAALDGKASLIGGKLDPSQVPDIAIQQYLGTVANQAAMLALVGQSGDWCSRSDTGTVFVITGNSAVIGGWVQLSYPASAVQSVCGLVGVVTLGQLASALASNFASPAQGAKADTALQPGVLPAGTTLPVAQINDAGAAGRTLLQTATMPEIQALVSGAGIEYAGSRKSLPLRALLASSAAGVQPSGPLLVVGDSTSWGLYAGGGPLGAWPQVLANMLTASGRPAASAGYGPQSVPAGGVVDSRITPGAGWSKSIYGFGAVCEQSGAATTPLTYTVNGHADTIKLYFLRNGGLGTIAVGVNGTGVGSVATAGSAGIGTQAVNFSRAQNPSITLTPTSNVFILYAEIYDSTAKSLRICNAGVAGSRADQWADATTWGSLAMITAMAPAHTVIMLGRNDAAAGRTDAQYLASISAIAARAAQTGGVTLMSAIGGNVPASEALLAQYLVRLRTLTQYPLIIPDNILGGYAAANAAGLMFDVIHENGPGHGVMAGGIFGAALSL